MVKTTALRQKSRFGMANKKRFSAEFVMENVMENEAEKKLEIRRKRGGKRDDFGSIFNQKWGVK